MITSIAATAALILLAAALILGVTIAVVRALRDANQHINTILDDELERPGNDDQFTNWPAVRTPQA